MSPKENVNFGYEELMKTVNELTSQYPFADFRYLGNSILGRGIPLITLGSGKRAVLYVGAHHGMEWITSTVLCRFLHELCALFETKGRVYHIEAEALLDICTFYIIPMLNVDGVEYQINGVESDNPLRERLLTMNGGSEDFGHWQANARGVDLNHNYNAGFAEYKRLEQAHGISHGAPTRYSGEEPESEPEVAALCHFIRFHENIKGILTLHTQGEEIYFKSGGVCLPKSASVAEKLSRLCGYQLSQAEGLASYGGLTDWCVQKMGIPSFTLECGKGENPLPASDALPIYTDLRQALFVFPTLV